MQLSLLLQCNVIRDWNYIIDKHTQYHKTDVITDIFHRFLINASISIALAIANRFQILIKSSVQQRADCLSP